jgi:mycofactocin precursor
VATASSYTHSYSNGNGSPCRTGPLYASRMDSPTAPTAEAPASSEVTTPSVSDDSMVIDSDLLVEEISIDGMCGVY